MPGDAHHRGAYDRGAASRHACIAVRAAGSGAGMAGTAPVGPADCAVGRPRRGVLRGRGHGRGAVQPSSPVRHSHLRSTGRPQPRHPRQCLGRCLKWWRPGAARPPITCGPPATMPCFGYTISCATPICPRATLPHSVRCRRCVWSRSTGWWRSGWRTAAAASSTPRGWRREIARSRGEPIAPTMRDLRHGTARCSAAMATAQPVSRSAIAARSR